MVKHITECKKCPEKVKALFGKQRRTLSLNNDSTDTAEGADDQTKESNKENIVTPVRAVPPAVGYESCGLQSNCRYKASTATSTSIASTTTAITKPKEKLSTKITSYIDTCNELMKERLDQALARALFSGTIPFRFVENGHFKRFLQLLKTAYIPPGRTTISTVLLDKEYLLIQKCIKLKVENATSMTLLSDGWADINGIPLINIILSCPEPIFIKAIDSQTEKHTAGYIFSVLDQVIDEYGPEKIHTIDQIGKEIALLTLAETRWSSLNNSIESLLKNKEYIQAAVFDKNISNMQELKTIKKVILDENFWTKLSNCYNILSPISKAISLIEGDKYMTIQFIYLSICEIENCINEISDLLPADHKNKLTKSLEERKQFLLYDVHLAAHLLDPKQQGNKLDNDKMTTVMEFILKVASDMGLNENDILLDLVNYNARNELWEKGLVWKAAACTSSVAWWKGVCKNKILSEVVVRILNFPASSASCERNWKDFALIKTKKRNRLTIQKTEKLVAVKYNLKLLKPEDVSEIRGDKIVRNDIDENVNNSVHMETEESEKDSININSDDDDTDMESYNTEDILDEDSERELPIQSDEDANYEMGKQTTQELELHDENLEEFILEEATEISEEGSREEIFANESPVQPSIENQKILVVKDFLIFDKLT
ncbi:hypothetical protein NQ315_014858 [Exocentrus adspersus]|uniref:DUF659 domain-containing protein n=1 Tax=Exocentrus adspersus TaxID=1586481 RepID=A0AAV8VLD4_9CUCU|nr:hypothetical protein NQ315_014858 [Exocentrus adspersus]